jgi:hypothetical protein
MRSCEHCDASQVEDLQASQASQAAATPVGGGSSGSGPGSDRSTRLVSIIDATIVSKVGIFSGIEEDWKTWCFVFESTTGLIDLDGIRGVSEAVADEVGLADDNQTDIKLRMKALYHLLVSTTRGRALTIMQMVPKNNGSIGWRRLQAAYEPRSGGRLTAVLMSILQPEWDEAAQRGPDPGEAAWKVWEKNGSMYEVQAAENISPGTKIALVTRWAPPDVKAVIRQALGAIGVDYNKLSQLIKDFIASGKVYEASGNRESHREATPMDVGAIFEQGKGKSKGKKGDKRDKCLNCGKPGHGARDCWAPGGGATKGLVKSKDKGRNKTGKDVKTINCF